MENPAAFTKDVVLAKQPTMVAKLIKTSNSGFRMKCSSHCVYCLLSWFHTRVLSELYVLFSPPGSSWVQQRGADRSTRQLRSLLSLFLSFTVSLLFVYFSVLPSFRVLNSVSVSSTLRLRHKHQLYCPKKQKTTYCSARFEWSILCISCFSILFG